MASSLSIAYCTDQDVFDIYPRISQYDYKSRLPSNWSKSGIKYTLEDFTFIRDEENLTGAERIIQLYANGKDLGSPEEDIGTVNTTGEWFMQLTIPRIVYADSSNTPNDMIMELGEDRTNLSLRFRKKASRLIESFLGSTISREIIKDREGNYPTSIIQATALKTALLILKAYNPNDDDIVSLEAEFDDIINKILLGKIVMPGHRTYDDSKGIVRLVTDAAGSISYNVYPVELKGDYTGNGYELLSLYFMGYEVVGHDDYKEVSYWVKGKSENKLKDKTLIEETKINYDYQNLGVGNLQIRFGFPPVDTEVPVAVGNITEILTDDPLTTPIEYEIELWGDKIQPTVSQINSIGLTKRDILWH